MNTKKIKQYILRIKDSFIEETDENRQMLDIYMKHIDGSASDNEVKKANHQLKQVFKSFGMGILVILPFSVNLVSLIRHRYDLGLFQHGLGYRYGLNT